jgi:MoxR-like ATPase
MTNNPIAPLASTSPPASPSARTSSTAPRRPS